MLEKNILDSISNAVVTVPGVASFANFTAKLESELKTVDISKAVEIKTVDTTNRVKVHIILINGVNISDVVKEVQIRVKYELEKLSQFVRNYIVDVAVDDLIVI
ncbi:Asp23/Gls24 family envelope stress response protein [Spiroplasma endosymbiont of Atherix ibis]|uniref:Asp23/Gls24 family envelope stress response protein n=1 Tax=Spiroplasma endosymbiont of Atherix ibis TaxID=3066291 RepID=UPI0030D5E4D1